MIYCFDQGLFTNDGTLRDTKYDAEYFRNEGTPVTFVFTKLVTTIEMERIYYHLKIKNENIIWLYTGFTGNTVTPISYTLEDLANTFGHSDFTQLEMEDCFRFSFYNDSYTDAYFHDDTKRFIKEAHTYSKGHLIRKDYFSHGLIYSEFYRQKDGTDILYLRRYYKTDRSTGFDEVNPDENVKYVFENTFVESKESLVEMMLKQFRFTKDDTIILDCDHKYLQEILLYKNGANLMMVRSSTPKDIFEERFNI